MGMRHRIVEIRVVRQPPVCWEGIGRRVAPDRFRGAVRLGAFALEAGGVGLIGDVQRLCISFEDLVGAALVDVLQLRVGDARVAVRVVVPTKEGPAVGPGGLQGTKAQGEAGSGYSIPRSQLIGAGGEL